MVGFAHGSKGITNSLPAEAVIIPVDACGKTIRSEMGAPIGVVKATGKFKNYNLNVKGLFLADM